MSSTVSCQIEYWLLNGLLNSRMMETNWLQFHVGSGSDLRCFPMKAEGKWADRPSTFKYSWSVHVHYTHSSVHYEQPCHSAFPRSIKLNFIGRSNFEPLSFVIGPFICTYHTKATVWRSTGSLCVAPVPLLAQHLSLKSAKSFYM